MKNEIEKLIEKGEYESAIKVSETLDNFEHNYYKGIIAVHNSEIDWGVEHLLKALEISDDSRNGREKKLLVKLHLVFIYQIGGQFTSAKKILISILETEISSKLEKGLFLLTTAIQLNSEGGSINVINKYLKAAEIFESNQELIYASFCYQYLVLFNPDDKKLDYIEKARILSKRAGNSRLFAYLSCFKGYQHQTLGEYNKARDLNQFAYDESNKLNFKLGIVNSTFCLARIGLEEGKIKYSIDQMNKIDESNFQMPRVILEKYSKILSYRLIGELDKAYDLAIASIDRFKADTKMYAGFGLLYFQIVLVSIELGKYDEAKKYQTEFENMVGKTDNTELKSILKFNKAIILKQTKRMKDILNAQDIFYEILEEKNKIEFQIKIEATRHLCEILCQEYEFSENDEVLDEAQKLLTELDIIAEEQHLIRARYEFGILKSKIFLLQGELEKSKQLLEDLEKRATDQNLSHFEKRVAKEIDLIKTNFQKWMDIINNNQSLKEIINESNIRDYFNLASQLNLGD